MKGVTPPAASLPVDNGDTTTTTKTGKSQLDCGDGGDNNSNKENNKKDDGLTAVQRRSSFKKSASTAEDCTSRENCTQDVFVNKLNSMIKPKNQFANNSNNNNNNNNNAKQPQTYDGRCYIDNGKINFGKMLTDEVLAADYKLVEAAKRTVGFSHKLHFLFDKHFILFSIIIDKCCWNDSINGHHGWQSIDCGQCGRFTWCHV